MKNLRHTLVDWTKTLVTTLALFFVIRTFLIQTFVITSGSMENTLLIGDMLVLNKAAYGAPLPGTHKRLPGYTEPKRGDIVVFHAHHEDLDLVKRLIGLPGDTLEMRAGRLFRNSIEQQETYVQHVDSAGAHSTHPWMDWQKNYLPNTADRASYHPTRDDWGPLIVPANRYFLLGDNRDQSLDSRFWGLLDLARVKGRAAFVYYSYERDAVVLLPFLHGRWSRIGTRLH
jgi:signal peptidase I